MMDKQLQYNQLISSALRVRESILLMSTNGGCFTGASLSCADIIVYLYGQYLRVSPDSTTNPNRDYLFLSKGHDVPALYATLAEFGFIDKQRLSNHLHISDNIYWHPNTSIPGIEFHSGSLGHLLSVAMGVAYDCLQKKQDNKIVVIVGDGELNEGSLWEGFLVASALKLHNIIVIVDRNKFQANVKTEELIPLESLDNKFSAFGWNVQRIDGHDFYSIDKAMKFCDEHTNTPHIIIADTVRGKGVPSIEERADRWFCNFTDEDIQKLLNELHGTTAKELDSPIFHVR
ncbi:MAG TPA: thiamine pyrophosphate-dependent enzyme [Candidatus Kapabacteria bacterium]|nr:thiamine pyrophosphate-dependent enzyme [Candidatus Kapabacteria bacterium]